MPMIRKNESKKHMPRSSHMCTYIGALLLVAMLGSTCVALAHFGKTKAAYAAASFTFTADGDYGQSSNTTSNLQYIGNTAANGGSAFNLGLGDYNYSYPTVPALTWVNFAQSAQTGLGSTTFPFAMTEGDHDTGDMSALINDMPNQIANVSGSYGYQYSFDYPATNPIARFIMVSPNVSGINYTKGGAGYTWVSNAVSAAKKAGYWVIVGMAEGCLYTYSVSDKQPCATSGKNAGLDLFNLLVSQGVDLILQAHVHNYQASKQLAFTSSGCTTNCCPPMNATTINQYNLNCVVNATKTMTRGAGTVIVNTGTGGKSLVNILNTDPKANYFRAFMGSGTSPTFGVSQFTLSATQLTENFVPLSLGTYRDSFTISNSSPTPTETSTSTATPTSTTTPGTTLAQDTFVRTPSSQPLWGTASDTHTWGADANTLGNFSISNTSGQVVGTGSQARGYTGVLGSTATNAEVQVSGSLSSFGGNTLGSVLRWSNNGSNFYKAYLTGKALIITKKVNGNITQLKSIAFTATAGTSYTLLFSASGSSLAASVWPTSGSNPGAWMVTATDSDLASGNCGILVFMANGVSSDFTAFQATLQ